MTASTITSSMTQWPRYKQIEQQKSTAKSDDFWQCSSALSSMDGADKVQSAAKNAKNSISKGSLFCTAVHGVSLAKLRASYLDIAVHGVTLRYSDEIIPLQNEVIQLAQEIGKVIGNKESFKASDFSPKLAKLTAAITTLYEKAQAELQNVNNLPIGQDRRCYKDHIKTLDKHFMTSTHNTYLETMNKWSAEEKISNNNTQEQCWLWKGQQKGLKVLITKLAYLAHSVHKCACCLDVLDKNRSNDAFWVSSVKPEKKKSTDEDCESADISDIEETLLKIRALSSLAAFGKMPTFEEFLRAKYPSSSNT